MKIFYEAQFYTILQLHASNLGYKWATYCLHVVMHCLSWLLLPVHGRAKMCVKSDNRYTTPCKAPGLQWTSEPVKVTSKVCFCP